MTTRLLPATDSALKEGARVLADGGLVAFPTETVYGLGANALSSEAVARIFEAKGRPATNPVIVHVLSAGSPGVWSPAAHQLAAQFWPGPLTLVVPTTPDIPELVTAGGDTVGLRSPCNRIARELLELTGFPIAAPSANSSSGLSPTTAEHVMRALRGKIELVLDGGPCERGIESTVLDTTTEPMQILRPGGVSLDELRIAGFDVEFGSASETVSRSPGLLSKHYSPRTPVELVHGHSASVVHAYAKAGILVGWIVFSEESLSPEGARNLGTDPIAAGRELYATLHTMDELGLARIVIEFPPDSAGWVAIKDRILRAAGRS